jgi:hypothetical protein
VYFCYISCIMLPAFYRQGKKKNLSPETEVLLIHTIVGNDYIKKTLKSVSGLYFACCLRYSVYLSKRQDSNLHITLSVKLLRLLNRCLEYCQLRYRKQVVRSDRAFLTGMACPCIKASLRLPFSPHLLVELYLPARRRYVTDCKYSLKFGFSKDHKTESCKIMLPAQR